MALNNNNNNNHEATAPKTRNGAGLQLRALNVEKGSDRFPAAKDVYPPRTSSWRCNLTALSQRRNLLFVACGHQIYVWEPAGGSQMLGSRSEMIITPVMKEPGADGYIQPASPHEINSILVDDLGRDEVLLLVTDSGNVCGYRVDAIFSALKRAAGKARPLDGSDVDPFFIEYVGASAWGLAIHKFARLIAVSANTGLVTVFAFALVNSASDKGDNSFGKLEEGDEFTEYGATWLHISTQDQFKQLQNLMPEKHRTRNIKLTYTGHFTNIPSVGFLNSDFDPNGMWMVSTDIDNKTFVWKVWGSLGPFNAYQLGKVAFGTSADPFNWGDDRGWSVIALDPRTFHPVKSEEEACGGRPQRRIHSKTEVLDVTDLSKRLPDTSRIYNYFPPAVKSEPEEAALPDIFEADCRINGNGNQKDRESRVSQSPVIGNTRPTNSAELSHQAVDGSLQADEMSEDSASDTGQNQENGQAEGHLALLQALMDPSGFSLFEALGGDVHEVEALLGGNIANDSDDDDPVYQFPQDQDMEDISGAHSGSEGASDDDEQIYQIHDPPANADFPILHFSHTDIHLIPHPFALTASVVCSAPLRQPFTQPIVHLRGSDRLNMVKYITEHGIVVAVSQKGRAAIIALTETATFGRSFRIDWILPLESQEKYGERPLVPLLGMSVSPMQGFEMPPDVPYIPLGSESSTHPEADADINIHNLSFQYKDTTNNNENDSNSDDSSESDLESDKRHGPLTLPEHHARATRAYQPHEPWRGWNPSRRYRLLLMYADHTVLSYEFWYTWTFSSNGSSTGAGISGDAGPGAAGNAAGEEDFLIL
ncbi:uncharacterized protein BDV17DRAFT_266342 [Aspergillus undulatus]|uniref:uncharacterized protein n=1 Tax=Aspergillus undulatus TaxID=1810928 RepID=UPI003CCCA823